MKNRIIKAFKGFNSDMTCRDFQYEEGHEYKHSGPVAACKRGFHACEHPLDCFGYYPPASSVYHEVELSGDTDRDNDDTKVAASHIKIGARLDIAGICKAAFEYVKSRCTNEHNAEPGKPATAGDHGAATAGDRGAANRLPVTMVFQSHAAMMSESAGASAQFSLSWKSMPTTTTLKNGKRWWSTVTVSRPTRGIALKTEN